MAVSVTADLSSIINNFNKLQQIIEATGQTFEDLAKNSNADFKSLSDTIKDQVQLLGEQGRVIKRLNQNGIEYARTIEFINKSGEKEILNLRIKDGLYKSASISIDKNAAALKNLREQANSLANTDISKFIKNLGGRKLDIEGQKNLIGLVSESKQLNLSGIDDKRLAKLKEAAKLGETIVTQTKEEARFLKIANDARQLKLDRKRVDLGQVAPTIREKFGLNNADFSEDADFIESQRKRLRKSLQKLKEEVKADPTLRIDNILTKFTDNPESETFNTPQLLRVRDTLSDISGLYEKIANKRAKQAAINDNSLNTTTKSAAELAANNARIAELKKVTEKFSQASIDKVKPIGGFDNNTINRITTLNVKIAELAQKAKITDAELENIFTLTAAGKSDQIEPRLNRIISKVTQLQDLQKRATSKVADNFVFSPQNINQNSRLIPGAETKEQVDQFKELEKSLSRIKTGLQYFIIYQGFNVLKDNLVQSVVSSRNLQLEIAKIRTISQDAQLSTQGWGDQLTRVSNLLGKDLKDVTKSAFDAVSNQVVQGQGVFDFIEKAGKFAQITGSTLTDSQNLLSSVFNSYGLTAADTEKIAGKLFTTIDKGRVVASDLSNTFGRVAFIAADLGVSLDEVLAILATLTIRGVTTQDAITLLNNGMQKVTKPSEALTKVFDDLGFSSGRAAVNTLGYTKVLETLTKLASEGKIDPTEIFPEARSERFFAAIRSALPAVQENIRLIGDESEATYNRAIKLYDDTPALKLQKAIVQVENTFTNTFGNAINNTLVKVIDLVGGFDKVESSVKKIINVVVTGTAVYATYNIASSVALTVSEARALSLAKEAALTRLAAAQRIADTIAIQRETAALVQLEVASNRSRLSLARNPVGLALTGIAAVGAGLAVSNVVSDATSTEQLNTINELATKYKQIAESGAFEKQINPLKQNLDLLKQTNKEVSLLTVDALKNSKSFLDQIKVASDKNRDKLKANFVGVLDQIKKKVQELESVYNALDGRIASSKSIIAGSGADVADPIFALQNEYAAVDQKGPLIENRIRALNEERDKITQLAIIDGEYSEDRIKRTREISKEIIQLRNELERFYVEQAKADLAAQGGGTLIYDKYRIEVLITDEVKKRNQIEQMNQEMLIKRKAILADQIAQEKEKNKRVEEAVKAFESFDVTQKDGQPRFKNAQGGIDIEKTKSELVRLAQDVKDTVGPNADAATRLGLSKLINERVALITEEIRAIETQQRLKQEQDRLTEAQKKAAQAFTEGEQALKSYNDRAKTLAETLKQVTSELTKGTSNIGKAFADESLLDPNKTNRFERGTRRLTNSIGGLFGVSPGDELQRKEFDPLKKKFQDLTAGLGDIEKFKIKVNGIEIIDPERLQGARNRLKELADEFDRITREKAKRLGIDTKDKTFDTGLVDQQGNKVTVEGGLTAIKQLDKELKDAQDQLQRAKQLLEQFSSNNINDKIKETVASYNSAQAAAAALGGTAVSTVQNEINIRNQLIPLLERQRDLLKEIKSNQDFNNQAAAGAATGGAAFIGGRAFGGPVGSDKIAMRGENEYVMNPRATAQYYSQINQMNTNSRVPESFSNNVNATFNITESKGASATAQQVKRALQRLNRTRSR